MFSDARPISYLLTQVTLGNFGRVTASKLGSSNNPAGVPPNMIYRYLSGGGLCMRLDLTWGAQLVIVMHWRHHAFNLNLHFTPPNQLTQLLGHWA